MYTTVFSSVIYFLPRIINILEIIGFQRDHMTITDQLHQPKGLVIKETCTNAVGWRWISTFTGCTRENVKKINMAYFKRSRPGLDS